MFITVKNNYVDPIISLLLTMLKLLEYLNQLRRISWTNVVESIYNGGLYHKVLMLFEEISLFEHLKIYLTTVLRKQ